MSGELKLSIGQHSERGQKESNQDFHGAYVPLEPQLSAKGIAIALADGISSSDVSHIASEATVKGFLEDYFCTSDAWSVKKSAQRVLTAMNSWLYAQTRQSQHRYDTGRGYVCTLSALVVKSATAHVFHVGDSRIYRLRGKTLEQLTNDHQVRVSGDTTYLSRALGMNPQLEIDYQGLPVEQGDIFIFGWNGSFQRARQEIVVDEELVHYHWEETKKDEFFSFKVYKSEISNDTILEVSDYAEAKEVKEQSFLWDKQIEDLKHAIGA